MSEQVAPDYLWRFRLVVGLLLVCVLVVIWRIVDLHVIDRDFLRGHGDARTLRTEVINAHRGMITDRHGAPLAVSTPVVSIWANPQEIDPAQAELTRLARALALPVDVIKQRLQRYRDKEFVYLKRHLTPAQAERVLALELAGVYGTREYKRYYPAAEVTAHMVGFTDVDDRGQEGLELAYDQWLTGVPGRKRVLKDRKGRVIRDLQVVQEAKPGQPLTLSLDLGIQYMAYRELKAAVTQHGAEGGSLVMLDVDTGEVLAMVNQPSYNPNNRASLKPSYLRNRALTDVFEPGSTMKPLTVAAALLSGRFRPDTIVDTTPGYLRLNRQSIRDHRNYGKIDVTTILTKSSNVGVSKLALALPEGALWNLFYQLGLGQATGVGFPGESVGTLPNRPKWSAIELATLSYGYGLSVTALQLAQSYLTLASGGVRRPVSLLKVDEPPVGERILPERVARQVLAMLETVVQPGGTATRARVPAYRVAGKTGTVHKVGAAGYEEDQYRALFAGIAPLSRPRIVAVVVIDSPSGREYYGGEVAAPVFSRVMANTLRLLNIPPDDWPEYESRD